MKYRVVTDYLEETAKLYPDKIAFADSNRKITFSEIQNESYHVASALIDAGLFKKPVIIYLDKSVECVCAFQGVAYSGNFYSPLDIQMPQERILKIVDKLKPAAIITDRKHIKSACEFSGNAQIFIYEDMQGAKNYDREKIYKTVDKIIDSDVLYVLFTSGSTGVPKGVIISHRGLVDLTEWITEKLEYSDKSVMASQTPFYFSFSVYDIYQTLKCGATTYIVPHELFSFPAKLMQYLYDNRINTIVWVPSILSYISTLKALNKPHLPELKNVLFGAEAMSTKQLNRWIEEYPNVKFVNLYGPTEVTDTNTYYVIDRHFNDDEMLPIGQTCLNKETFLLDEDKLVTEKNQIGEICVRGSGLAYGYYNDFERTADAFVQNPLNSAYAEIIYRTGDLAKYNDFGEMVYVCRKDFQIKHKGHRIELGEIETACLAIEGVDQACCLYDKEKTRIVLFYKGSADGKELIEILKTKLTDYMIPGKRVKLDDMPLNLNGKIDRQKLKSLL